MKAIELLRREAGQEFKDLLVALDGIEQELSWAVAPLKPDEYLHNNGSILGIVQHVASCKFMYGSAAFRNLDVRWRHVVARLEEIGAD